MQRLLEYGSVAAIPFYNCSRKSQSEWFETGAKHPILGYSTLAFGVFIETLYLPIIYIIFKTKLIRHACYKIIILLAMVDMTATVCSCFISSLLLIQGAVFCSYPTLTYITGAIVLATWCTSCACTFCLFLNRIVHLTLPLYAERIESRLANFSIFSCVLFFFYLLIFTPSTCFNTVYMAWLADPMSEEVPSKEAAEYYHNAVQEWMNWIYVGAMLVFYAIYIVKVKRISRGQKSKASMAIFIQCSIICFFNTVCALVYNSFAFMTPSTWILILAQVCWCVNHGCPALIYVTMNSTIRKEFLQLIFRRSRRIEDTSTILKTSKI